MLKCEKRTSITVIFDPLVLFNMSEDAQDFEAYEREYSTAINAIAKRYGNANAYFEFATQPERKSSASIHFHEGNGSIIDFSEVQLALVEASVRIVSRWEMRIEHINQMHIDRISKAMATREFHRNEKAKAKAQEPTPEVAPEPAQPEGAKSKKRKHPTDGMTPRQIAAWKKKMAERLIGARAVKAKNDEKRKREREREQRRLKRNAN